MGIPQSADGDRPNAVEASAAAPTPGPSESTRVEQALAQEQVLMQTLMDYIPDFIYFKDRDSRFVRVNRALAQLSMPARPSTMNRRSCRRVSH